MQHTKSLGHWLSGSGEEVFLGVFTIYGHGGHFGRVTRTIWTIFRSRVLRSLHTKFELNWPSGFRGEDVWKCWRTDRRWMDGRTDGRWSHGYTISLPMSLQLRWANNKFSFLKEGLPSWKQHVHLVCWEHLQIGYCLHCTKPRHRRTLTIVIELVGKILFWQKKITNSYLKRHLVLYTKGL